jgi:PmbA protein
MNARQEPGIDALKDRVGGVLKLARSMGASQAEATASFGSGLTVTARLRDVETLEYHRDQGLGVTVYFGQRKGSASTSDMSDSAVEETVRKACALAKYTAEDECSGLADADQLARIIPDLDLYHPWEVEPPAAIELAKECEAAALDMDSRITNSEGATVTTHAGCRIYGNSHGFLDGVFDTQHSLSCAVLAAENGAMERDYDFSVARDPDDLLSAAAVGGEAGRRAIRRLGSRKMKTVATPVLYPARLARGLFGHFLSAISGGNLYRKSTFLLDSIHTPVFADKVSMDELPHIPKALGSSPYDAEGVATCDRQLVTNGVLNGYVLGSYYARKLGLKSTGNAGGVHNLTVSNTGQEFADLIKAMGNGFLVTELMGQGVNYVTGDYSRGAAGFWVENGEIQYPVSEVTVAGNLKKMFMNIAAIGTDTDFRSSIRTGSVLVDGMTVAGN